MQLLENHIVFDPGELCIGTTLLQETVVLTKQELLDLVMNNNQFVLRRGNVLWVIGLAPQVLDQIEEADLYFSLIKQMIVDSSPFRR